jgi:hypothetical protein
MTFHLRACWLLVGLAVSAAYYDDWGGLNEMARDSFNVAPGLPPTNSGIPEITAPAVDAVLAPGERITVRGAGGDLSWSVEYWSAKDLAAGMHALAHGSGSTITFTVPNDASGNTLVRASLTGRWGSVYRDFKVGATHRAGPAGHSSYRWS